MTACRIFASISIAWTTPSTWCWRRRARPIPRSTFPFIRAGGISSSNGDDRWAAVADRTDWPDRAARARAEFDLAIVSVLLDAGAGPSWRYRDPDNRIGRSAVRKDWGWRASRCSRTAHSRPIRASRCGSMPACSRIWRRRPRARHAGLGRQSAGRARRPRRPAAPPRPAGGLEAGHIRQQRHAAARRPVRSARDAGGRRPAPRADDPVGTAAATRADLAVAADARRRSRSATAGGIRR